VNKAYIGIDPGQSGGIAVVCSDGTGFAWPMMDTERDIYDHIISLKTWCNASVSAVIERVHSMPRQGVASTFKFGMGYGALRMALVASGLPWRDVTPQAWQKEIGCLTGGDKNVSKAKAQQLFPSLKITHATADCLLIAEWLRRQP
jgi:crossover junction endodeoxyribonuclease RuvC